MAIIQCLHISCLPSSPERRRTDHQSAIESMTGVGQEGQVLVAQQHSHLVLGVAALFACDEIELTSEAQNWVVNMQRRFNSNPPGTALSTMGLSGMSVLEHLKQFYFCFCFVSECDGLAAVVSVRLSLDQPTKDELAIVSRWEQLHVQMETTADTECSQHGRRRCVWHTDSN